jgi:hypothetical protein
MKNVNKRKIANIKDRTPLILFSNASCGRGSERERQRAGEMPYGFTSTQEAYDLLACNSILVLPVPLRTRRHT